VQKMDQDDPPFVVREINSSVGVPKAVPKFLNGRVPLLNVGNNRNVF
jgi:hypothetical protein